MSFYGILFTILLVLLLLRVFVLKGRETSLDNEEFKKLPKGEALAVLKDRLLSAPTRANLRNLADFCGNVGIHMERAGYEGLLKEQAAISKYHDALARDNELFEREAKWLDSLPPPELAEAEAALDRGERGKFRTLMLTAVLRFYSDEKIEEALAQVAEEFPEAGSLLKGYEELKAAREASPADEASLKELRAKRNAWVRSVEAIIAQ